MAVAIFGRTEFEAALVASGVGAVAYVGENRGEHCYTVTPYPTAPLTIFVRSSIHGGTSAECGDDSIRVFIVKADGLSGHGGKSQRWVTRVPGWERRLAGVLMRAAGQLNFCVPCGRCGELLVPFTVKNKESDNKGRPFVKCMSEGCNVGGKSAVFAFTEDDDGTILEPPAGWQVVPTSGAALPPGRPCPKCQRPAVGPSKFGPEGSLYCFPKSGGCGAKLAEIQMTVSQMQQDRRKHRAEADTNEAPVAAPARKAAPWNPTAFVEAVENMLATLEESPDAEAVDIRLRSAEQVRIVKQMIQRFHTA